MFVWKLLAQEGNVLEVLSLVRISEESFVDGVVPTFAGARLHSQAEIWLSEALVDDVEPSGVCRKG